jgi:hypothetical protein
MYIVSVDGLSIADLRLLVNLLPKFKRLCKSFSQHELSGDFDSAQPLWAEILTGKHWYENGCVGYARLVSSLNQLTHFNESDLLTSIALLDDASNAKQVTINVPILRPRDNRTWLSDGSLPINQIVSPRSLLKREPFSEYSPRPFSALAYAPETDIQLVEKCLRIETTRLECAAALFADRGWSRFIYRLTIFDHLSHLLGINFLRATDLSEFKSIQKFLSLFDDVLENIGAQDKASLSLISAYSHVPCRGTLNLNNLLRKGGFFPDENLMETGQERISVSTAFYGTVPTRHHLSSLEGRVKTSQTLACSPISGCVFINSRDKFEDGFVTDQNYKTVKRDLGKFLKNSLSQLFGHAYQLAENPTDASKNALPEFVVKVDGVEFQNLQESLAGTPRTTHSSKGFVLLPKGVSTSSKLKTVQVTDLLTRGDSRVSSS